MDPVVVLAWFLFGIGEYEVMSITDSRTAGVKKLSDFIVESFYLAYGAPSSCFLHFRGFAYIFSFPKVILSKSPSIAKCHSRLPSTASSRNLLALFPPPPSHPYPSRPPPSIPHKLPNPLIHKPRIFRIQPPTRHMPPNTLNYRQRPLLQILHLNLRILRWEILIRATRHQ